MEKPRSCEAGEAITRFAGQEGFGAATDQEMSAQSRKFLIARRPNQSAPFPFLGGFVVWQRCQEPSRPRQTGVPTGGLDGWQRCCIVRAVRNGGPAERRSTTGSTPNLGTFYFVLTQPIKKTVWRLEGRDRGTMDHQIGVTASIALDPSGPRHVRRRRHRRERLGAWATRCPPAADPTGLPELTS